MITIRVTARRLQQMIAAGYSTQWVVSHTLKLLAHAGMDVRDPKRINFFRDGNDAVFQGPRT